MNDEDLNDAENNISSQKRIEEALKEIDRIHKEKSLVKSGDELEALERRIIEATDRLAGALVAQKIQDCVESPELKKEGLQLAKSYPKALKNQGLRDVPIRPSRGESFTVKSRYFSQKGKRKKK